MNLFDMVGAIQKQVKAVEAPPTEGTANIGEKLCIVIKDQGQLSFLAQRFMADFLIRQQQAAK